MILLIDNYDSFSYNLFQFVGTINPDIKVIRNDGLTVSEIGAAINAFNRELLSNHIHSCVVRDIREGKDEVVDELMVTLQKLIK